MKEPMSVVLGETKDNDHKEIHFKVPLQNLENQVLWIQL